MSINENRVGVGLPVGSNQQIQFNNNGLPGASANLLYDGNGIVVQDNSAYVNLDSLSNGSAIHVIGDNGSAGASILIQSAGTGQNSLLQLERPSTSNAQQILFTTNGSTDWLLATPPSSNDLVFNGPSSAEFTFNNSGILYVGSSESSGGIQVGGDSIVFGPNGPSPTAQITLNSLAQANLALNRGDTTHDAFIQFQTSGSSVWALGTVASNTFSTPDYLFTLVDSVVGEINLSVASGGPLNAKYGFSAGGTAGVSGTITAANTVTVVNGIITAIA